MLSPQAREVSAAPTSSDASSFDSTAHAAAGQCKANNYGTCFVSITFNLSFLFIKKIVILKEKKESTIF